MPARVDDEIWLYLVADFKILDPALIIGYDMHAESGELLYRSSQIDGRPEEWPRLRLGRAVLRAKIPCRLLNEGIYRIELAASLYLRQWIVEPGGNTPWVILELRGGLSNSPLRTFKRPGLLAPVLQWELCEAVSS
jgi:lipopolysaccharide transport system ATP-binding protein